MARSGGVLDLTGPNAGWPAESQALWRRSLHAAELDATAWDTPPATGTQQLRAALAAELELPVEGLAVTGGIRGRVPVLLAGAERLLIEQPSFRSIPVLARRTGIDVVEAGWEQILATADVDPGRVLWMTSPARNPDGRTLAEAEARRLEELSGRSLRVVVNQAYLWCAPDSPRPQSATLIGSLHKLAGGGAMLGWQWTEAPAGPHRPAGGGPPMIWQRAWAAFLEGGGLPRLVRHALIAPSRRCAQFRAALPASPGVRVSPGAGPSLIIELDSVLSDVELVDVFASEAVLVGAGSAFGQGGCTVRLCFTGVDDDDIAGCVERVEQSLDSARKGGM